MHDDWAAKALQVQISDRTLRRARNSNVVAVKLHVHQAGLSKDHVTAPRFGGHVVVSIQDVERRLCGREPKREFGGRG
jgi:hypothetical protein